MLRVAFKDTFDIASATQDTDSFDGIGDSR
jgi:hypothetical protein